MDKFEEIRPYYDHEVESKLRELASNKNVINAFLASGAKAAYEVQLTYNSND